MRSAFRRHQAQHIPGKIHYHSGQQLLNLIVFLKIILRRVNVFFFIIVTHFTMIAKSICLEPLLRPLEVRDNLLMIGICYF